MLRSYRVFNVEQTEDCRIEPMPQPEAQDHDPIEQAEAIIAGMPGPPGVPRPTRTPTTRPTTRPKPT